MVILLVDQLTEQQSTFLVPFCWSDPSNINRTVTVETKKVVWSLRYKLKLTIVKQLCIQEPVFKNTVALNDKKRATFLGLMFSSVWLVYYR